MQSVPTRAGGAIPRPVLFALAAWVSVAACLWISPVRASPGVEDDYPQPKLGRASYYGYGFAGRRTASGDRFHPDELTAAHRFLPLGTKVRVTNLVNGRSVLVTINDRGPYVRGRNIDLSLGAARELGMLSCGVTQVLISEL
jgi:rare lipoprotein A (peptidoglycan hydrolase)